MQLVAYRNTERSAHYTAAPSSENQRLASQVSFMERRKAELSDELKELVKGREAEIKRLAAERRMAQREAKAEREKLARALAREVEEHARRRDEMAAEIMFLTGEKKLFEIAQRICKAFGISAVEMMADRRDKQATLARHAVCYWACRLTRKSLPQIGRFLGNRDHTTVMHGRDSYVAKRRAQGRVLREVR